jgi:hypothetical protein
MDDEPKRAVSACTSQKPANRSRAQSANLRVMDSLVLGLMSRSRFMSLLQQVQCPHFTDLVRVFFERARLRMVHFCSIISPALDKDTRNCTFLVKATGFCK